MAKTPPGDFQVTILETPLLSQQAVTNKGGIINDCPLSMTNRAQWINIAKINSNQSVPALIPLDRPQTE